MREIEVKARTTEPERIRAELDSRLGEGREVHKRDHYFHLPGVLEQSLRIRCYDGKTELTTKHNRRDEEGENNLEYEFLALPGEYDKAVAFFHALGHVDYFIKTKDGWEWNDDDAHIELLSVNDLGWFVEIEILLPFDASDEEAQRSGRRIHGILSSLGVEDGVEPTSYRDMILERRKEYGMEG